MVSVPGLIWDDELGAHAQTWANYLAENMTTAERKAHVSPHAKEYQMNKHSEDSHNEGENIAWSTAHIGYTADSKIDTTLEYVYNPTAGEQDLLDVNGTVDAWASEAFYYDYSTNKTKKQGIQIGHYTQIIWKNTTKVGCGKALSSKDTYFNGVEDVKIEWVVCRYLAPGNVVGEKPY